MTPFPKSTFAPLISSWSTGQGGAADAGAAVTARTAAMVAAAVSSDRVMRDRWKVLDMMSPVVVVCITRCVAPGELRSCSYIAVRLPRRGALGQVAAYALQRVA